METVIDTDNIPQWKKDLIARLRNQNKSTSVAAASLKDQQLYLHDHHQHSSGRQPQSLWKNDSVSSSACNSEQCNVNRNTSPCSPVKRIKMVQERNWVEPKITNMASENFNNGYHKESDSDSSEDLQYGPGIVKKLKNKYLSLALRESNSRPSIMHMRKATSLENLLDEDLPKENNENKHFQSRLNGNVSGKLPSNRYHRRQIHGEMKRARSVEAISRFDNNDVPVNDIRNNRQSLHEDMLIMIQTEGNDTTTYIKKTQDKPVLESNHQRINRPKRIQPIMNEKEKPPADYVKNAKMIFEKRAEQRTKKPPSTGEVQAKVDSFNSIIVKAKVEAKVSKKPPVKHAAKPVIDKNKNNSRPVSKPVVVTETKTRLKNLDLNNKVNNKKETVPLPSPIPDISRIDLHHHGENENTNLSETPDLILTSSPLQASSPVHKKISTENFLREEIRNTSPVLAQNDIKNITSPTLSPNRVKTTSPLLSPTNRPFSPVPKPLSPTPHSDDSDGYKTVSPSSIKNISTESTSAVFNFTQRKGNVNHLPVNKNILVSQTPMSQPLKIDVNGQAEPKGPSAPLEPSSPKLLLTQRDRARSPPKFSPPPPPKIEKKTEKVLTVTEIEKNLINTVKTLQQPCVSVNNTSVEVVNKNVKAKKLKPREEASNTAVFNFTKRKDVPDYISNDTSRNPSRAELPKVSQLFVFVKKLCFMSSKIYIYIY